MAISKEKKKALDGIMGKVRKKFGDKSVSKLGDVVEDLRVTFHKTPSHEVNAMLDGGLGKGRIIEFFGNPGCGKTHLALEQIASEQKVDPEFTVGWLETEGSLDPSDIEMFGIDMDRFYIIEQSEDLLAEEAMDIIRSLVSSGEFNMIVVNSVAALCPKKEVDDELEKQNIALTARLLSKFLRITASQIKKTKTTLILINQVRTNLNSMYGGKTTSGGIAIPFYATQRIEMRKEKVESGDPIKDEEGIKVRCKVIKNRLAKKNPFKTCHYYALYGQGIDSVLELGTVLPREGIVNQSGAWIKYLDDKGNVLKVPSNKGEVAAQWNGKANFVKFLRENDEARKLFEGMLDKKLSGGDIGISLTTKEIEELSKLEKEVSSLAPEEEDVVATA